MTFPTALPLPHPPLARHPALLRHPRSPTPHPRHRRNLGWIRCSASPNSCIQHAARIHVATVQDTTDADAETAFKDYLQNIFPHAQKSNHALTQKLLANGLTPPGMELPSHEIRVEAELFREANLLLQAAEQQNAIRFNKLVGTQTVTFDNEETTITQLSPRYMASNHATHEQMWHQINAREQADHAPINTLWAEVIGLRLKIAENTGFGEDYRAYRWQYLKRFSYTPADCRTFHAAIEQVAVPAHGARLRKTPRPPRRQNPSARAEHRPLPANLPHRNRRPPPLRRGNGTARPGQCHLPPRRPALAAYFDTICASRG